MILNILILNQYQNNLIFISLLVLKKIWEKNWKKIFLRGGGGGCLIMAMSTDAFWGGHFSVEPGIFLSNRAFFCRTMHFAVEPGFFVSDECYNVSYSTLNKGKNTEDANKLFWNIQSHYNPYNMSNGRIEVVLLVKCHYDPINLTAIIKDVCQEQLQWEFN